MQKEKAGLYIHIPFCLRKCAYCNFYSVESVDRIPDYLKALKKEMVCYRDFFSEFDTIYLGGGTPSLLAPQHMEYIFSSIHRTYKISSNAEITIEMNPGDMSLDFLKTLRHIGVGRINIGVQSFDDRLLGCLGRRHTAREAVRATECVRQAGFDNWGIDLIYGIRGQSKKQWEKDLVKAMACSPPHLSCYQLSLDSQTPLYRLYASQGWPVPCEKTQQEFFFTTSQKLQEEGYLHYEVSNFAKNEYFQSKHNWKYWRHAPYLGLGSSAHSYLEKKRWWNKADLDAYLRDLSEGKMPVADSEMLNTEKLELETLFLGFRTREGVDLQGYQKNFGYDLLEEKKTVISLLMKKNLLTIDKGFIRPTLAGMAVADSLALI